MNSRSCVLGGLGWVVLPGCFVEEPPPMTPPPTATESSDGSTGGPTTSGPTTDDPTTAGPTTDDPTTGGPITTTTGVDDTTTDDPTATETGGVCEQACEGVACGMVEGCEEACGMCAPMATCAEDQSYCGLPIGFHNDFGYSNTAFASLQFGHRFQVFEDRVVRQLGVISWGAGQDVRLALYDHDGTGPANRIVQTGEVTLYANGPNEFNVGATAIGPGEYWVMAHTEIDSPLVSTANTNPRYELAARTDIPFASGFPETMDDEFIVGEFRWNLYMVVED